MDIFSLGVVLIDMFRPNYMLSEIEKIHKEL